ncbi:response regulator [candidate division KSB1 bacterium]|nr:response regulator [candidate division KSB1 bacterium]
MPSKPKKVLLIDDDSGQRRLLKRILLEGGDYEVIEAMDGLDALNILLRDKLRPDLMLLDLTMPYIDGLEFIRIIKNKRELNNLPILICSSVESTETVREITQLGIRDILTKPVDKEALSKKVLSILLADSSNRTIATET